MRHEEFEQLYEAHAGPLLAFLEYRIGNVELAQDLHADTFERALKARFRFDQRRGSQKTWLYSIALNALRDHVRRAAVESRAMDKLAAGAPASGPSAADDYGTRDELRAALEQVGEDEREALALRFGADLSLREIASITGTKETTVKGRIHRGLRKMREELG
jgi:RNA polymerase sigma factor (sigma-70 family)